MSEQLPLDQRLSELLDLYKTGQLETLGKQFALILEALLDARNRIEELEATINRDKWDNRAGDE